MCFTRNITYKRAEHIDNNCAEFILLEFHWKLHKILENHLIAQFAWFEINVIMSYTIFYTGEFIILLVNWKHRLKTI